MKDNDAWSLLDKADSDFIWHDDPHLKWEMMEKIQHSYPYLYFGWLNPLCPQILYAQEAYA